MYDTFGLFIGGGWTQAARIIALETGKPIAQSGREWGLCVDQFHWFAEEARRIYGRQSGAQSDADRVHPLESANDP